ncbi:MAG TPA: EamA family transporter [Actinophytocola sp.]|uniref:EamA family transporter n=1 Tax=Actinophytocola sp. TaxID=1872138 RepID=UPI002DDD54E9|nr:EamA family transporter [Actinophytocola sp.]HEV2779400.1 EamA family transporter [Actinophytocola sp.]
MTTSVLCPPERILDWRRRMVGLLLAIGAAVAMGGAAPALKKLGSTGLSAVNVVQARTVTGAVVLLTLALVLRRGRMRVGRRDWWLVGGYGLVSLAVNQVVFTTALARLPVGVALLLEYLAPVLVALWVRFVQRGTVSGLVWVGMAGTLLGLGLVGRVWAGFALDGVGFALGLLAAATLAARFVLAERGLRRHDPLVLAAWGTTVSAGALLLTGLVEPFPMALLAREGTGLPTIALVLWVGLVGTAGGVLLVMAAQRWLAPTSASLVLTLEVVAGAGMAYVVLGETPTVAQLMGGVVMLAGIAMAQLAITRRGPT